MTAEMGPRDVDLSLSERFAAHGTRYTTRLLASTQDDLEREAAEVCEDA